MNYKKPLVEREGVTAQLRSSEVMAIGHGIVGGQTLTPDVAFQVDGKASIISRIDEDQRDLLVGSPGMIIFNETSARYEEFVDGAWRPIGEGLSPGDIDCGTF